MSRLITIENPSLSVDVICIVNYVLFEVNHQEIFGIIGTLGTEYMTLSKVTKEERQTMVNE